MHLARLPAGPVLAAAFALALSSPAAADEDIRSRIDVEAAQAILAVQTLDGWLLHEHKGANPIALELVNPEGELERQWFYFIPAEGQPTALVHKSEAQAFEQVPGRKIEYGGYRDLKGGLRTVLKGAKRVAMEYAPESKIPSLTRVDAATVSLVKKQGVKITSSADLVQFTKSLWGPEGRVAHYVAVHHLTKIREEVLDWLAERMVAGKATTELDLQREILDRMKIRGVVAEEPPVVATGAHTADPTYQVSSRRASVIERDDLILLDLRGRLKDAERPIYANLTWMAYAGDEVPDRYAEVFDVVVRARDAAVDFIRERVQKRRAVKGFEADQRARAVIGEAGFADRFVHRTGHSLDTDLHGAGANLDDYETHDTRNLVQDTGFTVGPGVYVQDDFGVRSEIDLYIGRQGLEVTSPVQAEITPILTGASAAKP